MNAALATIKLDPTRFQNRTDAFSELSAEAVARNYDPNKFDPVVLWRDPAQNGQAYMLSGHSRFEGMSRRGNLTIPARFFQGTEAEAIQFARVDANRAATAENLVEDLTAYRLMRDGDEARHLKPAKKSELAQAFKGKQSKLEAWSHLDAAGLFVSTLAQDNRSEFPYLEKFALWVGQLRGRHAELTNTHESDYFNFFYSDTKNQRIARADFEALIEKRLAWGKPRLFPECDRSGCVVLDDLAKRGPQADAYKELELLAKYRETITQRLRTTDRGLRVYTDSEREKLKEQGQLIDLEVKRLQRDLGQAEAAPGLFGASFAGDMREFTFYEDVDGNSPVEEFLDKLPKKDRAYILAKLLYYAGLPAFSDKHYKPFKNYPFDFGELRPLPYRIFVHRYSATEYVMVHGFRKKTENTPPKETAKAKSRILDFINRQSYEKTDNYPPDAERLRESPIEERETDAERDGRGSRASAARS